MRISDWSSDVCSSDLRPEGRKFPTPIGIVEEEAGASMHRCNRAEQDWDKAQRHDARIDAEEQCNSAKRFRCHHQISDEPWYADRLEELRRSGQIGRASCRERVCQYG